MGNNKNIDIDDKIKIGNNKSLVVDSVFIFIYVYNTKSKSLR